MEKRQRRNRRDGRRLRQGSSVKNVASPRAEHRCGWVAGWGFRKVNKTELPKERWDLLGSTESQGEAAD